MLLVDLREFAHGAVETRAELAGDDPLFEGVDVALAGPVHVTGRLQAAGEARFYWRGSLATVVASECRRCLQAVSVAVKADIHALFTKDSDALEDPDCYPVPREATQIDLRPAVREELLLAVPQWVLCREDCRGLCPRCGKDLNAGACGCALPVDDRWQPLAALKDKVRD